MSSNGSVDFMDRLNAASDKFMEIFQEWVESKAISMAHSGKRYAHFKYPIAFNEKLHGFRLSTYIKGFRMPDGSFSPATFLEMPGYTEETPTPYEKIKAVLRSRGIVIQDVSNPLRGLGFWVKISY